MALRKGVYAAKAGRDNRSRIKGRNTVCMIAINEEEVCTHFATSFFADS
jgi:hypothetical protein